MDTDFFDKDPDFITALESELENMEGLEDMSRLHCTPDGDSGILRLVFDDGRSYSVNFERA